jgi:multidrug resistance efflux pump
VQAIPPDEQTAEKVRAERQLVEDLKRAQAKEAKQAKEARGDSAKVDPAALGYLQDVQAQIAEATAAYRRAQELFQSGLAAKDTLVSAEATLERLRIKFKEMQAALAASEKDRLLASDQPSVYASEIAKLDAAEARIKLDRTRELLASGLVGKNDVAAAELTLKKAQMDGFATYRKQPATANLTGAAADLRDRVSAGAPLSDDDLFGVLKRTMALPDDRDRSEVLLAVARFQLLSPDAVTRYIAAANSITSEDERNRVFKEPVRLKPGKGK